MIGEFDMSLRSDESMLDTRFTYYGRLASPEKGTEAGWNPEGVGVTEADLPALLEVREMADNGTLEKFHEPTANHAAETCGDSRSNVDLTTALYSGHGPSLMGASTANVVVAGLVNENSKTLIQDAQALNAEYRRTNAPFGMGDHYACGGLGEAARIISLIANPASHITIDRLLPIFAGERFYDPYARDEMFDKFAWLKSNLGEYLPEGYNERFLHFLEHASTAPSPVERLVDEPHQELDVGVNHAEWTRFSREAFNLLPHKSNRVLRRFSVDAWYPPVLASEHLYQGDPEAASEFTTGIAVYNIATLMTLTNGSLGLTVRDLVRPAVLD